MPVELVGHVKSKFHLGKLITECEQGIIDCFVKPLRFGGYLLPQSKLAFPTLSSGVFEKNQ